MELSAFSHQLVNHIQSVPKDSFADIADKELLNRFYIEGENKWLGILLQRYTILLLGVCMKYLKNEEEARDAVQQIFLKVIIELPKYKVEYFKSWLYMIARNYCLMKLRNSHGRIPAELTESIASAEDVSSNELLEKDMALTHVEDGLTQLNEEQKQCVTLFYLQKKSYQQISSITGYTMLQVKSFIQNGRRNLKLIVERKLKSNG